MENYICGDMTYTSNYAAYFSNAYDHQLMYNSNIEFQAKPYSWESFSKVHTEGEPSERYWMNVQVIPFATMGVTWDHCCPGWNLPLQYGYYRR